MKKYCISLFISLASFSLVKAQDIHFSQFSENPSLLNPALAGANGMRASLNYKNQWKTVATPYKTYGASFEMRSPPLGKRRQGDFGSSRDPRAGRFGFGLSVYKDKSGDGNLNLTQANLSIAYFVPTGDKSALSLGVQTSYTQRKIEDANFVFPNQYNGSTGYDPGIASGENFGSQNYNFVDFAGGILWSYGDQERRIRDQKHVKAHVGFAMYHLTQPKQKILVSTKDNLLFKYVAHGDFHISIQNTNLAIVPAYVFQMQGSSMEILAGALLRYYNQNDTKYTGYIKRTSFSLGAYYRNNDAAILYGLIEWQEQYALGLSYDMNISPLKKISGMRGGLELTLRYNAANTFLYQKMK